MLYIEDGRALLGAFALILTGIVLSVMIYLYFSGNYGISAISTARVWWEIIMNFQVLSIACIWFCYANAIYIPVRNIAVLMRIRLCVAMFAVMIPLWIVLVSVFMNWFVQPPTLRVFEYILLFMFALWVFSTITPRVSQLRAYNKSISFVSLWHGSKTIRLASFLPLSILLMLVIYDMTIGKTYCYYCMPFLLYLQSAVPYLRKGISFGERTAVAV